MGQPGVLAIRPVRLWGLSPKCEIEDLGTVELRDGVVIAALSASPRSEDAMNFVLHDAVRAVDESGRLLALPLREVTATSDPVAFMKALPIAYVGSTFRTEVL